MACINALLLNFVYKSKGKTLAKSFRHVAAGAAVVFVAVVAATVLDVVAVAEKFYV